jgi:hypothetical protein
MEVNTVSNMTVSAEKRSCASGELRYLSSSQESRKTNPRITQNIGRKNFFKSVIFYKTANLGKKYLPRDH